MNREFSVLQLVFFSWTLCLALTVSTRRAEAQLGPIVSTPPPVVDGEDPSAEEQSAIYELNLARHNPQLYGFRIRVPLPLSDYPPRPPLAVNTRLTASARGHSLEMDENNYFGHCSPVDDLCPNNMTVLAGYDLFGEGLEANWGKQNNVESIAKGIRRIFDFVEALSLLIEDRNIPNLSHRVHLLASHRGFTSHREIGAGRVAHPPTYHYTIHTAHDGREEPFITGVVYDDFNCNGRYDAGEGLGDVDLTLMSEDASVVNAKSLTAGGYAIRVPPGSRHELRVSGGAFQGVSIVNLRVGVENLAVDFKSGEYLAEVGFAGQAGAASQLEIATSVASGLAPLDVEFTANYIPRNPDASETRRFDFAWDFGGGVHYHASNVSHRFADPGLYTVRLNGSDPIGTGKSFAMIPVAGTDGAGPGTQAPASTGLVAQKLTARVKFNRNSRYTVKFRGEFEMPAGFVSGEHPVEVSIAGVRVPFVLNAKNRARNGRNNLRLKYKNPTRGAPLPPGVRARLTVTLTGDCAAELDALAMRGSTETRIAEGIPFGFLLNQLPYTGVARMAVNSKAKKRTVAKLEPGF